MDLWITQARSPQPHRPIINKQNGHLTYLIRRTSSRVTDSSIADPTLNVQPGAHVEAYMVKGTLPEGAERVVPANRQTPMPWPSTGIRTEPAPLSPVPRLRRSPSV